MTIHEVIKSYRIARRFSQEEMAEKMHLTPQTYARWENGKTKMTDEKLELFAQVLGKTSDDIREATKYGNIINLLETEVQNSNDWQKVVVNHYYGETELGLEINNLNTILLEKDKLLSEKDKVIQTQDECIKSLKMQIKLLEKQLKSV